MLTCSRNLGAINQKCTRLIAGEVKLNDFKLATLSTEIDRILNDRPITYASTDPKDLSALTPNMLLNGVVETSLPADVCSNGDSYRRSWRKGQILADRFWSRWLSEYLPMLLQGKIDSVYGDIINVDIINVIITSMLAT